MNFTSYFIKNLKSQIILLASEMRLSEYIYNFKIIQEINNVN